MSTFGIALGSAIRGEKKEEKPEPSSSQGSKEFSVRESEIAAYANAFQSGIFGDKPPNILDWIMTRRRAKAFLLETPEGQKSLKEFVARQSGINPPPKPKEGFLKSLYESTFGPIVEGAIGLNVPFSEEEKKASPLKQKIDETVPALETLPVRGAIRLAEAAATGITKTIPSAIGERFKNTLANRQADKEALSRIIRGEGSRFEDIKGIVSRAAGEAADAGLGIGGRFLADTLIKAPAEQAGKQIAEGDISGAIGTGIGAVSNIVGGEVIATRLLSKGATTVAKPILRAVSQSRKRNLLKGAVAAEVFAPGTVEVSIGTTPLEAVLRPASQAQRTGRIFDDVTKQIPAGALPRGPIEAIPPAEPTVLAFPAAVAPPGKVRISDLTRSIREMNDFIGTTEFAALPKSQQGAIKTYVDGLRLLRQEKNPIAKSIVRKFKAIEKDVAAGEAAEKVSTTAKPSPVNPEQLTFAIGGEPIYAGGLKNALEESTNGPVTIFRKGKQIWAKVVSGETEAGEPIFNNIHVGYTKAGFIERQAFEQALQQHQELSGIVDKIELGPFTKAGKRQTLYDVKVDYRNFLSDVADPEAAAALIESTKQAQVRNTILNSLKNAENMPPVGPITPSRFYPPPELGPEQAVKAGHTRLYRGEREDSEHVLRDYEEYGLIPDESSEHWFTHNRREAVDFADGGDVMYVDVPTSIANEYKTPSGYLVPGPIAVKAKLISPLAAKAEVRVAARETAKAAPLPAPRFQKGQPVPPTRVRPAEVILQETAERGSGTASQPGPVGKIRLSLDTAVRNLRDMQKFVLAPEFHDLSDTLKRKILSVRTPEEVTPLLREIQEAAEDPNLAKVLFEGMDEKGIAEATDRLNMVRDIGQVGPGQPEKLAALQKRYAKILPPRVAEAMAQGQRPINAANLLFSEEYRNLPQSVATKIGQRMDELAQGIPAHGLQLADHMNNYLNEAREGTRQLLFRGYQGKELPKGQLPEGITPAQASTTRAAARRRFAQALEKGERPDFLILRPGKAKDGTPSLVLENVQDDKYMKIARQIRTQVSDIIFQFGLPPEQQAELLKMAELFMRDSTSSRLRRNAFMNAFKFRVTGMFQHYGSPGSELAIRALKGDKIRTKLLEEWLPHLNEIRRLSKTVEGTINKHEIYKDVIDALEDRANAARYLTDDIRQGIYDHTISILGEAGNSKTPGVRAMLEEMGIPVRDNYYAHILTTSYADDLLTESASAWTSGKKSMQEFLTSQSQFFKERTAHLPNYSKDLPEDMFRYIMSASKHIAYRDAHSFYFDQFPKLISQLKAVDQSTQEAVTYMRNLWNPETVTGTIPRAINFLRSRTYESFLWNSWKNSMQNSFQWQLALNFVSPEAQSLEKLIFSNRAHLTGALADAVAETVPPLPRFWDLIGAEAGRDSSRFRRLMDRIDTFQMSEIRNWNRSSALGVTEIAQRSPEFASARARFLAEGASEQSASLSALSEALQNPETYNKAVTYGQVLSAKTQVSPLPSMRATWYNNYWRRILTPFTAFKFRYTQVLWEHLQSRQGWNGARAKAIMERGFNEDVIPVEVLREVTSLKEMFQAALKDKSKHGGLGIVPNNVIGDHIKYLGKAEKELNDVIASLEPGTRSRGASAALTAKYLGTVGGLTFVFNFGHRLTQRSLGLGFIDPKETDEDYFNSALQGTLTDMAPVPFPQFNIGRFALPAYLPDISVDDWIAVTEGKGRPVLRKASRSLFRITPVLGVVDRALYYQASELVTDTLAPKKERPKFIFGPPPLPPSLGDIKPPK